LPDTYDRRCQLGASRRRFEDAQVLYDQGRWTGSIYLGAMSLNALSNLLFVTGKEKLTLKILVYLNRDYLVQNYIV